MTVRKNARPNAASASPPARSPAIRLRCASLRSIRPRFYHKPKPALRPGRQTAGSRIRRIGSPGMVDAATAPAADPTATMRSRQFRVLLVLAAVVGVAASAVAWGFLELVFHMQAW